MTPPSRFASSFASDFSARAAIESSLAARLAQALTATNTAMPHDLAERLRVSRERALTRAQQLQRAATNSTANSIAHVSPAGAATLTGGPAQWGGVPTWLSTLLPVMLVLAGLWAIGQLTLREQILTSADIDTQLLADELPPAAYGDPGFVQYLRHGPQE